MHCCQLWFNSTKSGLIKLSTSYNSVLRRLLCISKSCSASNMFSSRGIPSFAELLRKPTATATATATATIDLKTELSLVQALSLQHVYHHIRKWWSSVLHNNYELIQ